MHQFMTHTSERVGTVFSHSSEDASRGKEDRDRIQKLAPYEHDGRAHTSISSAARIPTNDDGVAWLPSVASLKTDAASGRQDSEYSSVANSISDTLYPSRFLWAFETDWTLGHADNIQIVARSNYNTINGVGLAGECGWV
jgi:hypothetical protein